MPLVGASPIYRPPVAGESLCLREDGHWSAEGLVGYWPMREMRGGIVQDVSGYGNHGTLVNGPTWVPGPDGRGAVRFDHRDYVSTSAPVAKSDFTWGARVRPTKNIGSWQIIAAQYQPSLRGYSLIGQYSDSWVVAINSGLAVLSAPIAAFDEWYMLAVTRRGSALTMYVDGNAVDTGSNNVELLQSPFTIGGPSYLGVPGFAGDIESVIAYNRALPAAEIRALYAAPDLPIWRPRRGISLAMLEALAGITYPWHTPGFNAGFARL